LVDDDLKSFYILTMILKLRNYDVIPYLDPVGVLPDFENGAYDLLLILVEMVRMNGFELYKNVKNADRHAKVCFMTNYRQRYLPEFSRLFPELTSDSLVDKPISANDLSRGNFATASWQMS